MDVQIVQIAAARRKGPKQALSLNDVKDELAQRPPAAALQCVEQLLEWRKSTPVYMSILEEGEDPAVKPAKGASRGKRP